MIHPTDFEALKEEKERLEKRNQLLEGLCKEVWEAFKDGDDGGWLSETQDFYDRLKAAVESR